MDNIPRENEWQEESLFLADYDGTPAAQHEDAVLKTMMQFFANELLPFFHIEGHVVSIAPTELVQLEIKKLFQDFNLVMDDGSWKHFEFQSTNDGIAGLKRFRAYEALTSLQHNVSVTTYVLYSGTIKHPVTEFSEGVNTYRIVPIIMQDWDADELIEVLETKLKRNLPITKEDLVLLSLCPLMGGRKALKERIKAAYAITKEATQINPEEVRKIEAVIYAMADKFLDYLDIEEVMEEMSMTRVGRMLVKEGIKEGIKEGFATGTEQTKMADARNLIDVLDVTVIAERIGLPIETVQKIKEEYLASQSKIQ